MTRNVAIEHKKRITVKNHEEKHTNSGKGHLKVSFVTK